MPNPLQQSAFRPIQGGLGPLGRPPEKRKLRLPIPGIVRFMRPQIFLFLHLRDHARLDRMDGQSVFLVRNCLKNRRAPNAKELPGLAP